MAASSGSLDATVLLRLILNDVPEQHQSAVTLFEETAGPLAVADIAMIELVFVLARHYEFNRAQIAEAVEGLMELTELNCNRSLFRNALALFLKYPKLSFEDCCLAIYAELNSAEPLWTFDQKLAKQVPAAKLIPAG